jgi:hypothetical protein
MLNGLNAILWWEAVQPPECACLSILTANLSIRVYTRSNAELKELGLLPAP